MNGIISKLLVLTTIVSSLLYTGCGSDSSTISIVSAISEATLSADSDLCVTENHIVVINLEPSSDTNSTGDTSILGKDTISFNFINTFITQLEVDNDSNIPVQYMYLTDTVTDTIIASATKGSPSAQFTVKANKDYRLTIEHNNLDEMKTLFVKFDNSNIDNLTKSITMTKGKDPINKLKTTNSCYECNFSNYQFFYLNLNGANLGAANLSGAFFNSTNLSSANLSQANLSEARFVDSNLSSIFLQATDLSNCLLADPGNDLTDAFLRESTVSNGTFRFDSGYVDGRVVHYNLSSVNFTDVEFQNMDLSDFNFTGANLFGASFTNCNLRNSNFIGIETFTTYFGNVDASGANFSEVFFNASYFSDSNLSEANFSKSSFDLGGFTNSNFSQADFSGATYMSEVELTDSNFSGAIWTDGITICGDTLGKCN